MRLPSSISMPGAMRAIRLRRQFLIEAAHQLETDRQLSTPTSRRRSCDETHIDKQEIKENLGVSGRACSERALSASSLLVA